MRLLVCWPFSPDNLRNLSPDPRAGIQYYLSDVQNSTQAAIQRITDGVTSTVKQVEAEQEGADAWMQQLLVSGESLWFVTVATTIAVLCISLVLSLGLLLGIIHAERAAKSVFVCGGVMIAIGSGGLVLFTVGVLLIGSHADMFLCRPMYGAPSYHVLEKLFDKPGWFYQNETTNGVLNDIFLSANADESGTLNVSLASVLDKCEQNEATFAVFQLAHFANLSKILDIQEYARLDDEIDVRVEVFGQRKSVSLVSASAFTVTISIHIPCCLRFACRKSPCQRHHSTQSPKCCRTFCPTCSSTRT